MSRQWTGLEGDAFTDNKIFDQPFGDVGARGFIVTQIIRLHITGFPKKDEFEIYKIDEKITVYDGNKKSDGKELFRYYK